ncbi:Peptidase S49 [Cynara cardunculus var. scolymus]|uniref:Peptidase S49 n=1 Tax=Cynara cardunculus var. scolymus TaxID=59895 RepID=A0A103XYN2_CYNCS|nr:Peptidase S49 [Cynara cardunculus var. scolymus]
MITTRLWLLNQLKFWNQISQEDHEDKRECKSELDNGGSFKGDDEYPSGEFEFKKPGVWKSSVVKLRMMVAYPWQRVRKGSVLNIKLRGKISDQVKRGFSSGLSLPQICENLIKAAYDPRISGVYLHIETLKCGWGKIEEIRRHILDYRKSGKFIIGYAPAWSEKEYYLGCACEELYAPPSAYFSLYGLNQRAQFFGGVLEKVGVEPQVHRIGKYKSAADRLIRKDMSEENREVLTTLLDHIYENWVDKISQAKGMKKEEIEHFINEGVYQVEKLKEDGWITDIKYDDEVDTGKEHVTSMLKTKLGIAKEKKLPSVAYKVIFFYDSIHTIISWNISLECLPANNSRRFYYPCFRKYSKVKKWTLGLSGGKDKIAVIRASGSISRVGGSFFSPSSGIVAEQFIEKIRKVRESKRYKAVIIRIDSPGGDVLASDLSSEFSLRSFRFRSTFPKAPCTRSLIQLRFPKTPCPQGGRMWREISLLAESKPVIASMVDTAASGGYYMAMAAQTILSENLTLTGSIGVFRSSLHYSPTFFLNFELDFVDKMEEIAQGRVWTGNDAASRGLVDAIGGFSRAVAIAKQKANIPQDKQVTLVELSRPSLSLTRILFGIGNSSLSQLVDGLTSSNEVQARMDGIMFQQSEGSSVCENDVYLMVSCNGGLDQMLREIMASKSTEILESDVTTSKHSLQSSLSSSYFDPVFNLIMLQSLTLSSPFELRIANLTPKIDDVSAENHEDRRECKSELDNGGGLRGDDEYPSGEFEFKKPGVWKSSVVKLRMMIAYPWQRVRKGSVLNIKLRGKISDQVKRGFSSGLSLPQICENLIKAAYDPRIAGVYLHIEYLQCGWGLVIGGPGPSFDALNRASLGQSLVISSRAVRPSECSIFVVRFMLSSTVLRRIGKYKNFGDQLVRKNISEENREVYNALLDQVHANWVDKISRAKGEVTLWFPPSLAVSKRVYYPWPRKYSRVKKWTVGLSGGKDRIAVIRASGSITRVQGSFFSPSSGIVAEKFIEKIRKVRASGGYYMAMAAQTILSEDLTLTDEEKLFAESTMNTYKQFRDKAARSRSMSVDTMEEIAQGRVWTGNDAASRGLVDAIGGFSRAVAVAKQKANIPQDKRVTLVELSRPSRSLTRILFGIGSSAIGIDTSLSQLVDGLTSSDEVQARMDGIMFQGSEGSSFADPVFDLLKDYLKSP